MRALATDTRSTGPGRKGQQRRTNTACPKTQPASRAPVSSADRRRTRYPPPCTGLPPQRVLQRLASPDHLTVVADERAAPIGRSRLTQGATHAADTCHLERPASAAPPAEVPPIKGVEHTPPDHRPGRKAPGSRSDNPRLRRGATRPRSGQLRASASSAGGRRNARTIRAAWQRRWAASWRFRDCGRASRRRGETVRARPLRLGLVAGGRASTVTPARNVDEQRGRRPPGGSLECGARFADQAPLPLPLRGTSAKRSTQCSVSSRAVASIRCASLM